MNLMATGSSEQILCCPYRGMDLVGTLHTPDASRVSGKRVGLVMLNSALRYRAGPHRLYQRLARKLCDAGRHVLRIDLPTLGDSMGEFQDVDDWCRKVMDNTHVVQEVVRFFQSFAKLESVGLSGLCLGATKALRSVAEEPNVEFLILLSPAVKDFGDYSGETVDRAFARVYLKKLLRWESWRDLLMLRSRFDLMPGAIREFMRFRKWERLLDERNWDAFHPFTQRKKRTLFIFGEHDEYYREFQQDFSRRLNKLQSPQTNYYDLQIVPEANHIFSQVTWQDDVAQRCVSWLQAVFATSGTHEPPVNIGRQ